MLAAVLKGHKSFCVVMDYLCGRIDRPPDENSRILRILPLSSPAWALLWGFLLCVILTFCGQSSKFIYIDF